MSNKHCYIQRCYDRPTGKTAGHLREADGLGSRKRRRTVLKKCAVIHRRASVVALFDVYSDPGDLLGEAADDARRRGVALEAIGIVTPLRAWLITIGRGMAPLPVLPVSPGEEEDAVVRSVTELVGTVPRDVPVRWRIFHGTRRRAFSEARDDSLSMDQAEADALLLPVQA